MAFNWADFHQIGNVLGHRPDKEMPDEARLRCAVGRVYYAVYWRARLCVVDQQGGLFGEGGSHERVINAFDKRTLTDCYLVYFHLDRLKKLRNTADYEANTTITMELFNDALTHAKKINESLDKVEKHRLLEPKDKNG